MGGWKLVVCSLNSSVSRGTTLSFSQRYMLAVALLEVRTIIEVIGDQVG